MTKDKSWPAATEEFFHELLDAQRVLEGLFRSRSWRVVSPEGVSTSIASPPSEPIERLHRCYQRRAELLQAARAAGLPNHSLSAVVEALNEGETKRRLQQLVTEASRGTRQLQLAGVTQWMLAQRSMTHVTQLLEILATGTPQPPTYGNGAVSTARGGLLDEAA